MTRWTVAAGCVGCVVAASVIVGAMAVSGVFVPASVVAVQETTVKPIEASGSVAGSSVTDVYGSMPRADRGRPYLQAGEHWRDRS